MSNMPSLSLSEKGPALEKELVPSTCFLLRLHLTAGGDKLLESAGALSMKAKALVGKKKDS